MPHSASGDPREGRAASEETSPTATSSPPDGSQQAPAAPGATTSRREARDVPRTRTGATFKAMIAGLIVLILLLVFILENTESVKISYFGAGGHLPLGVALLIAAIGGALLVAIVGGARIMQLRRHVKRRQPS